jgi:hypothetical protein
MRLLKFVIPAATKRSAGTSGTSPEEDNWIPGLASMLARDDERGAL